MLSQASPNTSLILTVNPQFLATIDLKQDDLVSIAFMETRETVWLRAIQRLTSEELGITNSVILAKFKALMVLQAHELFFLRQKWDISCDRTFDSIMEKIIKNYASAIRNKLLANVYSLATTAVDEDKDAFDEKLRTLLTPETTKLITTFRDLLQLEQTIFLAADKLLPSEKFCETFASEAQKFLLEYISRAMINQKLSDITNFDADELSRQCNIAHAESKFKKSVIEGAKQFNVAEIKKIAELKTLDLKAIATKYHFPEFGKELAAVHKDYLQFYDQYIQSFEGTVASIQSFIPTFTAELYASCYKKAFEIFTQPNYQTLYADNYIMELYLQKARRPSIHTRLHDLIVKKHLPMVNAFYQQTGRKTQLTLADIAGWVKDEPKLPPSLHEIIAEANSILHAPIARLTQHQNQLIDWAVQPTLLPAASSSALVPTQNSTQLILSLSDIPLFKDEKIPGKVSPESAAILIKTGQCNTAHTEIFNKFSTSSTQDGKKSTDDQKEDDRTESLNRFNAELKQLNAVESLEAIASLVATAKPYINRHRHNIIDNTIWKSEHVTTWTNAFVAARDQALAIIKKESESNPSGALALLKKWHDQPLFADKYYVSIFYGYKNAHDEMDSLIAKLEKQVVVFSK